MNTKQEKYSGNNNWNKETHININHELTDVEDNINLKNVHVWTNRINESV